MTPLARSVVATAVVQVALFVVISALARRGLSERRLDRAAPILVAAASAVFVLAAYGFPKSRDLFSVETNLYLGIVVCGVVFDLLAWWNYRNMLNGRGTEPPDAALATIARRKIMATLLFCLPSISSMALYIKTKIDKVLTVDEYYIHVTLTMVSSLIALVLPFALTASVVSFANAEAIRVVPVWRRRLVVAAMITFGIWRLMYFQFRCFVYVYSGEAGLLPGLVSYFALWGSPIVGLVGAAFVRR